jgi:hypothetical protein
MAYKTQFKPLERLGRDGWRRMDDADADAADDRRLPPLRVPAKRILVEA